MNQFELPAKMVSQGGIAFNHEHIEFWKQKADQAENISTAYAQTLKAQKDVISALEIRIEELEGRLADAREKRIGDEN